MSVYNLTPAERRARAQALKEARENRIKYKEYLYAAKKSREEEIEKAEIEKAQRIKLEEEKNNQNFFVRAGHTVGDIVANVLTGMTKGIEGLVDFGMGISGAVGGLFDKDFQDNTKELIAYDWTGETFGNALQDTFKYSYTNDGKVGEIVENVASGIGQMLPAIAITVATGGAGAPTAISQAASLTYFGASAAGTATEEAFNDGADYWAGLGYGVATGAVEVATEKMFGGATKALTGAGIFDGITKSVADTGLKRIAKNVIEEGVEEVVSELANPTLKSIYKGKDAFKEYEDIEYWKGVGKAGVVGSLTALAYSGSVGYGLSKAGVGYVGKEADIADSLNEISSLKEQANRYQAGGTLDYITEQKIADMTRKNYLNIEKTLKSLSEEKRAKYIKKFSLDKAFNPDGLMSDRLSALFNVSSGESETSLNRESYSFNLRGSEDIIKNDLDKIKADSAAQLASEKNISLEEANNQIGDFKVFDGEMSIKARESRNKFNKALNYLNKVSGSDVSFVITEENSTFNGVLLDGKIFIGEDAFENNTWAETLVHEYTHFAEGTDEYYKYINFLSKNEDITAKAEKTVQKNYNFDANKLEEIIKKLENNADITAEERKYFDAYRTEVGAHQSEYLLGNEAFIDRLVAREANLARKIIKKIQSLKNVFTNVDSQTTRAEHKQILKAEKLYLKAAAKAGNAQLIKLILSNSPELEKEIDNADEIKYNKKEFSFQHKNFPSEYETQSEAHRLAVWWATREDVEVGDQTLISMNDNWYLVEKLADADNKYQVEEFISKTEYQKVFEEIKQYGRSGKIKSISGSIDRIDKLNQSRDSLKGRESGVISNETQYGRKDNSIQRMGEEESRRRETSSDGSRDSASSSQNRQGDNVRYSLKDSVESDVVKEYGKTYRWSETGYILKDGTKFDLSGRNEGGPGGYRTVDHRDIFSSYEEYEDLDGTDAMIEFMSRGNIRVSPELPGISLQVEPTEEQYRQICEMVEKLGWEKECFSVDFDDKNGNTIDKLEYKGKVSFRKVISDIRYFFKEGKIPYQSELSDFRYSLKDKNYSYKLTDGQIKKLVADGTRMKVYSKIESEQVINTILDNSLGYGEKYGRLVGKSKKEAIEMLWKGLNTAKSGEQIKVALDVAEFIIQNSLLENIYEDDNNLIYSDTVNALRPYLRKLNLDGIKSEIRHKYDKDNSAYLLWGKRKGEAGLSPDVVAMELEESGFRIDAVNEAEIFFCIDSAYREAVHALQKKSKELLDSALNSEEKKALKNTIAREVMFAFDKNGTPSHLSKIVKKYENKTLFWKEKFYDEKERGKAVNHLFESIDRVKGFEKYQRADVQLSDEVIGFVKLLKKLKTYRGNIAKNARQIMAEYSQEVNGKKLYDLLVSDGEKNPFAEEIERIARAKGELTTQEIKALDAIIQNFIHNVKEYDRVFFEGRRQSETDIATTAIAETKRAVRVSDAGLKGLVRRYINWTTNPVNRFRRLGNYSNYSIMARMYYELQKGANKQSLFKQRVDALFDAFVKTHKRELSTYDVQDINIGGVKMSKGQMISLYLTYLREQGRSHLFANGDNGVILLTNEKAKKRGIKESYNKGEDVKVSRATIEEIYKKLTQTDKMFIELAREFFNGDEYSRGAIIETQEALYGVAMVEESRDYFPIRVADDQIYKEIGNDFFRDMFTVYSPSFTKTIRQGANNKIVIENALDVIKRHTNQMAAYYGLAQPIKTFNRIINKSVDGVSFRSVIMKADSSFLAYADKLISDLQGRSSNPGTFERVVGRIRSWGARAALGLNPKVWVNQVVSLPAANAIGLKYGNLIKGFAKALAFKTDFANLVKYSPLAYERFRNGSNLDVGLLYEERGLGKINKLTDLTTAPIQGFDKFTIGAIWNAALEQTKSNEYANYSDEHYKAAAQLTERAITETQPNYTVLQRPEILRSENELLRLGTMFMTQPLQNLSLLASGIDKFIVSKKQLNLFENGTEEYNKALKQYEEAKKELWHKASAVIVETALLVFVAELFKKLLGKEDDRDFGERFTGDFLESTIGMFPFVRDAYSVFQGYDVSNMYYTGFTNIFEGIKDLYSIIELVASGKDYDQTTINNKVHRALLGLSQTFGIPLRNLENYAKGIVGNINPSARLQYESLFTSKSKKVLTDKLKTAIENDDEELADTIVGLMLDEKAFGIEDDAVRSEIKALTINGYGVLPRSVGSKITYDGEEITLTKRQADNFKKIYATSEEALADLVKLKQYKDASGDVKAKAINFIYNVYYNLALQDLVGEDLETKTILLVEAVNVEKLAIIIATVNVMSADTDKNGKVISGTRKKKIQAYINSLELTVAQKYMIMGYLGYRNLKGEAQVRAYINRLKLTKSEKAKLLEYSGYPIKSN